MRGKIAQDGDEEVVILLSSSETSPQSSVLQVAEAWLVGGEVCDLLAGPAGLGGAARHRPHLLLNQDRHVSLADVDGQVNLLPGGVEEQVVLPKVGAREKSSQ